MSDAEQRGRDAAAINELLEELTDLRELDRRRHDHVPGSAAHDAATLEVDLSSRRLMNRFRDFEQRRAGRMDAPGGRLDALDIDGTRHLDAHQLADREEGSRLN